MTKMIKLSLVAAVAVAGLTTTSSAASMEEAIKGSSISGMVRYRVGFKNLDNGASTDWQHAKLVVGTKSKVNDKVTASLKFVGALNQADAVTTGAPALGVAKFTYANAGTTVTAGLMELATPWTDAGDGARANGVLATKGLGAVTIAAAHFRNSQMGTDRNGALNANDLTAIAAIGKAGAISYQAWYLAIGNGTSAAQSVGAASSNSLPGGGSALALLGKGKFGPVAIDASYASLEGDKAAELKKQTLLKAIASVKAGAATVVAGFASGGKDGNLVTFDSDAKVGFQSWNIRAGKSGQLDLAATTLAVVVPVGGVSLKAQYTTVEYDATTVSKDHEVKEMLFQASYKMSKNFGGYLRYATADFNAKAGNGDFDRTRLEIKYTF